MGCLMKNVAKILQKSFIELVQMFVYIIHTCIFIIAHKSFFFTDMKHH